MPPNDRPIRFHWSLSQAGDKFRRARRPTEMSGLPDLDAQTQLCLTAERYGVDSVLMAIGAVRPDPLVLSAVLAARTSRIRFMVACRSGLISPTLFVQQINTLSAVCDGRVCVNLVCGHTPRELRYYGDRLEHDVRYERTDEFLSICRQLWGGDSEVDFDGVHYQVEAARLRTPFVCPNRTAPEVFVGGNSAPAAGLAAQHADCLLRFPSRDEQLIPEIRPVLAAGKEVGLLVSLICRPTREEAVAAAAALIAGFGEETRQVHEQFAERSDSIGFRDNYAMARNEDQWLNDWLWVGAVPYLGAPAIALVGSYDDVATAIWHYRNLGISQFLLVGWPDVDELTHFGEHVLPAIRQQERATRESVSETGAEPRR